MGKDRKTGPSNPPPCSRCGGSGTIYEQVRPGEARPRQCPSCGGTGRVGG